MADNKSYKKSNFGSAFFFLEKDKKNALGIVYSFCRLADDIVDEDAPNAPKRLADLREEVDAVFNGTPQSALGKDLLKVIKKYPIQKQYFTDLLDGVESDLKTPVRYKTFADLQWYMYRVASVVGLMCLEVFGYKNPETRIFAKNMGYAVQLTNIVRDVTEDAAIDRIYLPQEDMESFGITEEDILKNRNNHKTKALLFFELERAQSYYNLARRTLPAEDFKNMMAARAMGAVYENLHKKLQKTGCYIGIKKIKLSKIEKITALLKTWREKP